MDIKLAKEKINFIDDMVLINPLFNIPIVFHRTE